MRSDYSCQQTNEDYSGQWLNIDPPYFPRLVSFANQG